MNNQRR
ncbi:hypothetical protein D030_3240A, partial [Vibrio parahaemolyticus AQ3810]